jgi:hypothetical protein
MVQSLDEGEHVMRVQNAIENPSELIIVHMPVA